MKKALFLYFSHTGQTARALEHLERGLGPDVHVDRQLIETKQFAFPWKIKEFFRVFVKCHEGRDLDINVDVSDWDQYDFVVLGYQSWFLSPSWPMQSFLRSQFARRLAGKNVFTLLTCRNLWYSTTVWVQRKLTELRAVHIGQATICETAPAWATFVTTPRWLLTGKKGAFWFFPEAGICPEEFAKVEVIGTKLEQALRGASMAPIWYANLDRPSLRIMDAVGSAYFVFASALILRICRKPGLLQDIALTFFRLGLVAIILVILPISMLWEKLTYSLKKQETAALSQ